MAASAKDVGVIGIERRQRQLVAAMHGMTAKVVHAAHQYWWALKQKLLPKGHACNHSPDPKHQEMRISQEGTERKGKPTSRKDSSSSSALSMRSAYSPMIQTMLARASGSSRLSRLSHSVAMMLSYLYTAPKMHFKFDQSITASPPIFGTVDEVGHCAQGGNPRGPMASSVS